MCQPSPQSSSARVLPPQPPTGNPAMLSVVRVVWVRSRPSRQVMVAMANPVLPSVQFPQHPRPSGLPGARAWIGKGESSPPFQPGTHVFSPRLKVTDRSRASDGPWLPTTRYCCARSALWWNVAKWAKGAACRRAPRAPQRPQADSQGDSDHNTRWAGADPRQDLWCHGLSIADQRDEWVEVVSVPRLVDARPHGRPGG
jgi:hypothetical protein